MNTSIYINSKNDPLGFFKYLDSYQQQKQQKTLNIMQKQKPKFNISNVARSFAGTFQYRSKLKQPETCSLKLIENFQNVEYINKIITDFYDLEILLKKYKFLEDLDKDEVFEVREEIINYIYVTYWENLDNYRSITRVQLEKYNKIHSTNFIEDQVKLSIYSKIEQNNLIKMYIKTRLMKKQSTYSKLQIKIKDFEESELLQIEKELKLEKQIEETHRKQLLKQKEIEKQIEETQRNQLLKQKEFKEQMKISCNKLQDLIKFEYFDKNKFKWIPYTDDINIKIIQGQHELLNINIIINDNISIYPKYPMYQLNKDNSVWNIRKVGDLNHIPEYWIPSIPESSIKYGENTLISLNKSDAYMNLKWSEIELNIKDKIPNIQIIDIQIIQNFNNWYRFNNLKNEYKEKANHKLVYHGTSEENIPKILNCSKTSYFVREYNKISVHGKGNYFAVNPLYSANERYACPNANNEQFMFLTHIIAGKYCKGSANINTPQIPNSNGKLYDSMVDNVQNPSIYVLGAGSDERTYPEFLIKFKKIIS